MKLVTILILVQFWTQSFGLPADICVGSGYFDIRPHPDNCWQYILCFSEIPTIVDCEENHIFDAINKECMPGYPDICEFTSTASPTTTTQSTTTTTLSDTTTTTLSDTTTTTLSDTTTTTLSDTTTTTTESGLPNNFCHGINFGRFPHPINCFQFVVCVNEVAHIIDCTYPTEVFYSDSCVPGNSTTCEVFTNGTTTTTLSDTTTTTLSDTTTTTLSDTTTTTTTLSDTTTTTLSDTTTTTTTTLSDTTTTTTLSDTTTTTLSNTTTTTLSDTTTTTTTLSNTTTTTLSDTTTTTLSDTTTTTLSDTTTTTTLSDTTTTTLSDTTTTTTEAVPEITTPLATTTTQRPNGPPELCIGNNLRFIPDPDYCFRFYYCLFGVALPGDCKPDNIFSEKWIGCVLGDWETCEPENPIFTLIPNHI